MIKEKVKVLLVAGGIALGALGVKELCTDFREKLIKAGDTKLENYRKNIKLKIDLNNK